LTTEFYKINHPKVLLLDLEISIIKNDKDKNTIYCYIFHPNVNNQNNLFRDWLLSNLDDILDNNPKQSNNDFYDVEDFLKKDVCPTIIAWKIVGDTCIADSGCDYDSSGKTKYYNSKEICESVLKEDSKYCEIDSDCQVIFSNCGCKNFCSNKYQEKMIDCARSCDSEESDLSVENCQCINNECVPESNSNDQFKRFNRFNSNDFLNRFFNNDNSEEKIWMFIKPIQCGLNSWERLYSGDSTNEEDLIRKFLEDKSINVHSIKIEKSNDFVCSACICPRGDTVYVLVSEKDIRDMENLGFEKTSMPSKN